MFVVSKSYICGCVCVGGVCVCVCVCVVCSGLNRQMHHKCIILGKILGFCPPWLLSAWILSSMGFCPHWILSPWVFVLLGFCLTWILSPWVFVPIGFCPPGFLSSLDFVRLDIVLWVFVQWDFVLEPSGSVWAATVRVRDEWPLRPPQQQSHQHSLALHCLISESFYSMPAIVILVFIFLMLRRYEALRRKRDQFFKVGDEDYKKF